MTNDKHDKPLTEHTTPTLEKNIDQQIITSITSMQHPHQTFTSYNLI